MSRYLKTFGRVPMLRKDRAWAIVRGFMLAAALLSWSSVASTQSPGAERLSADPTGEARSIALAELEFLRGYVGSKPGAVAFGSSDRSLIASAVLEDPFLEYGVGGGFYKAEWVDGRDLMKCLRAQVWFPVTSGGRYLGRIGAQVGKTGRWEWAGDEYGSDWWAEIVDFHKRAVVPARQRISILRISVLGEGRSGRFALLENGEMITSMLPLDDATWQFMGKAPGGLVLDPVKWLKAETVLPVIHTEIERMIESTDE